MAAVDVTITEGVQQPIWSLDKDAFAVPTSRRLIRGWDRTAVAAHAPRLHGHKVWKKVGVRSAPVEDKHEEVQAELLKEGGGSRKRARALGARENICNAIWADDALDAMAKDVMTFPNHDKDGLEQENTVNQTSNLRTKPSTHPEIEYVPRKRTHADHVITPKKPLRQSTIKHTQSQPLSEITNITSPRNSRPRKSLRKRFLGFSDEGIMRIRKTGSQLRLSNGLHPLDVDNPDLNVKSHQGISVAGTFPRRLRNSTTAQRDSEVNGRLPKEVDGTKLDEASTVLKKDSTPCRSETSASVASEVSPESALPTEVDSVTQDECDATEIANDQDSSVAVEIDATPLELMDAEAQFLEVVPVTPEEIDPLRRGVELVEPNAEAQFLETVPVISEELDVAAENSPRTCLVEDPEIITAVAEGALPPKVSLLLEDALELPSSNDPESSPTSGTVAILETELDLERGSSLERNVAVSCSTPTKSNQSLLDLEVVPTEVACEDTAGPLAGLECSQHVERSPAQVNMEVAPTETQSATAPVPMYDHDDTDMLRNFLTRVKANKAAKSSPKRKRSLPHSPLQIPLGDLTNNTSPSPPRPSRDVIETSPSKRRKRGCPTSQADDPPESKICRRSARTRIPPQELPGAPSFIPVRRLGQETEKTVNLRRNEEKELSALTRVNTRKNKGAALSALEVLARKAEEKGDPVMRQRLLKEVFDEKMDKNKSGKDKKGRDMKNVTWAEELAQFQILTKVKSIECVDEAVEIEKEKSKVMVGSSGEEKKSTVRVGVRRKATLGLGMAVNGTPAPKRKIRGQNL